MGDKFMILRQSPPTGMHSPGWHCTRAVSSDINGPNLCEPSATGWSLLRLCRSLGAYLQ